VIRIPGRIPIVIHPTFWIFAALIGFFLAGGNLLLALLWIGIIFVSVLFHEMGHALTALFFGRNPRIELVALGGLTYHDGEKLAFWKQFIIVFNGPLFGFFLYVITAVLLNIPGLIQGKLLLVLLTLTNRVNLIWTILNLLPVLPLDGGQLMRILFEGVFGVRGVRYSFFASMLVSLAISLLSFLFQQILVGAFFFLFAFQSFEAWRQSRIMGESDQKESIKKAFEEAEQAFNQGKKEEAKRLFEKIKEDAKSGMLYVLASQYLAFLYYEEGKVKEAYDLLLPVREHLPPDTLCLLHRLAFEVKDYSLVLELSGPCYQALPSAEMALRNAYASALLSQPKPAIGWLQTAQQEGLQNLGEVIRESAFDPVRNDPSFQHFLHSIKQN
jgi:stage IV sporulation protein FB